MNEIKILTCHNFYQQPGGEDVVFHAERDLLRAHGHEVICYTKHNDEIKSMGRFELARKMIWNSSVYRDLRKLIRKEKPHIIHFHNIFPLISPSAYYAAHAEGVPVVQTLHNYRLMCPGSDFFLNGNICELCLNKAIPWPGIIHSCYHKSKFMTAGVVIMLSIHKLLKTWSRMVNIYIAPSEFSREKFIQGGISAKRIFYKPNFVDIDPGARNSKGNYALFIGRLSPEKGLWTLLEAWKKIKDVPLRIAGDGPLMRELKEFIEEQKLKNIKLLGRVSHKDVINLIKNARFLIFSSEWYECFPCTLVETFACGVSIITSRLGAMSKVVNRERTGLHFAPGDPEDLADKVEWAWNHEEEMQAMGKQAREEYESKYTAERNYEQLMKIYQLAIEQKNYKNTKGVGCKLNG